MKERRSWNGLGELSDYNMKGMREGEKMGRDSEGGAALRMFRQPLREPWHKDSPRAVLH